MQIAGYLNLDCSIRVYRCCMVFVLGGLAPLKTFQGIVLAHTRTGYPILTRMGRYTHTGQNIYALVKFAIAL